LVAREFHRTVERPIFFGGRHVTVHEHRWSVTHRLEDLRASKAAKEEVPTPNWPSSQLGVEIARVSGADNKDVGTSGAECFNQDPHRGYIAAVAHRGIPVDDDCGESFLKRCETIVSLARSLGRWRTRAYIFPRVAVRVHQIIMDGFDALD
jgi:hypothetical protein